MGNLVRLYVFYEIRLRKLELTPGPASFTTCLGAIPLGSDTAFLDLAGSFIILTTTSYAIPFASNILSGRKYLPRGPFWMGNAGYAVNLTAVILIILFNTLFCFRKYLLILITMYFRSNCLAAYSMPTSTSSMNYNSVILAGVIALTAIWWLVHGAKNYPGPRLTHLYIDEASIG